MDFGGEREEMEGEERKADMRTGSCSEWACVVSSLSFLVSAALRGVLN